MTKHPNAPAEDKSKRKKQIPITLEEYDEIHRLWESGMTKKEISDTTGRSTGTISTTIIKLTREIVKERNKHPMAKNDISKYRHHEIEEQDFSKFPSTVLFQHSNEYIL